MTVKIRPYLAVYGCIRVSLFIFLIFFSRHSSFFVPSFRTVGHSLLFLKCNKSRQWIQKSAVSLDPLATRLAVVGTSREVRTSHYDRNSCPKIVFLRVFGHIILYLIPLSGLASPFGILKSRFSKNRLGE